MRASEDFKFRLDDGILEMYCLNAYAKPRDETKPRQVYCEPSCPEESTGFQKLMSETDFVTQASTGLP